MAEDLDTTQESHSKKSSSQRYRDQRDRALAALDSVDSVRDRQDALEAKLDTMLERLPIGKPGATSERLEDVSDPWASMSTADLQQIITSDEHADNRKFVDQAIVKLNERKAQQEAERVRTEMRDEYTAKYRHKEDLDFWKDRITKDYGEDAFDTNEDLFREADKVYRDYQRRYGKDKVTELPKFLHDSYREAADLLGIERREAANIKRSGGDDEDREVIEDQSTSRRRRRPPETSAGASEGHAERLSSFKQQVQQGDDKAAFQTLAQQLLSVEPR